MTPIVDGLATKYEGQLAVQRIDANQSDGADFVQTHNILGHPTTLLVDRNGQEIKRLFGPQSAEYLDQQVQDLLSSTN